GEEPPQPPRPGGGSGPPAAAPPGYPRQPAGLTHRVSRPAVERWISSADRLSPGCDGGERSMRGPSCQRASNATGSSTDERCLGGQEHRKEEGQPSEEACRGVAGSYTCEGLTSASSSRDGGGGSAISSIRPRGKRGRSFVVRRKRSISPGVTSMEGGRSTSAV